MRAGRQTAGSTAALVHSCCSENKVQKRYWLLFRKCLLQLRGDNPRSDDD